MGFEKAHETKHDEMQGGAEGLMGKLPKCRVTSNRMRSSLCVVDLGSSGVLSVKGFWRQLAQALA